MLFTIALMHFEWCVNLLTHRKDMCLYVSCVLSSPSVLVFCWKSQMMLTFCLSRNLPVKIPDVKKEGEDSVVLGFKYLGIITDSHSKHKFNRKKSNLHLANVRQIRNNSTTEVLKLYINALILSHMNYCLTSWTQTVSTTLWSVQTLCKHALINTYYRCKHFWQSAFSIRPVHTWNTIPTELRNITLSTLSPKTKYAVIFIIMWLCLCLE